MKYDIICVGSLTLDILLDLPFMPRASSECFMKRIRTVHGGAAANVAAYAAYYGNMNVGLVSRVGTDPVADELLNRIKEYSVDINGVRKCEDCPSPQIITVQITDGGRRHFVFLGPLERMSIKDLPESYVRNSTSFYVAPSTPEVHSRFVELAIDNEKIVAFNPGSVYVEQAPLDALHRILESVDILFLNEDEALCYSEQKSVEASGTVFGELGVKHVVVTRSDLGCYVFSRGELRSFGAYRASEVSSSGAGDAFAAGFLAAYLDKADLEFAAKMGNILGAFAVTQSEVRRAAPSRRAFSNFSVQSRSGSVSV